MLLIVIIDYSTGYFFCFDQLKNPKKTHQISKTLPPTDIYIQGTIKHSLSSKDDFCLLI